MSFVVFVYSHYSPEAVKFLKLVNDNLDTLEAFYNYKMECLCVDDDRIKRIILASKKLIVRIVPSVIVITEANAISVHEGTEAFNWLYDHPEIELPMNEGVRQTINDVLYTTLPTQQVTPVNVALPTPPQITSISDVSPIEVLPLPTIKTAQEIKSENLMNTATKMQQQREEDVSRTPPQLNTLT